jgi:multimeric flavodoxin WrbA
LVIGAPVYYGDINGLTKDFMDTVRISNANGKHGLGVSIAGGSGKGLCLAVQSIYSFFYYRQIRGIDPTPVSRFNFQETLDTLYISGQKLAELSKEKKPFKDLWDRIEYYENLHYLNFTFLDEILLLTEQLIRISSGKDLNEAKRKCEIAKSLTKRGKRIEAVKHVVKAYDTLYF